MLLNICNRYERMRCSRIKQHNCRKVVDGKCTDDHVRSFLGFLNCDMIDLSANIVLPSSNRNRICPTGSCRSGHSCRRRAAAQIGTLVSKVTFLPTSKTLPFPRQWVLSSLSPVNILIPSNRSLGIAGAWHRLVLQSRISSPRYLRPCLEQRLSRMEHKSSGGRSDTWSGATAWLLLTHQLTLVLHHASAVQVQEPCSPSLESSQSPEPPEHRLAHHSSHSGSILASSH
jgi:hypothetical protein